MGSSPLMTDNSYLCCTGHVCKTSKDDNVHGAYGVMLCGPSIGIVSSFSESGFGRSNHYIMRGFFYVERDAWLRRGGFLLCGLSAEGS